ncbi:MAG: hypothetical protein GXY83_32695 [Rhodopirellula sp.]|nr:hypothetical protein [Rhodopirellula sp.]
MIRNMMLSFVFLALAAACMAAETREIAPAAVWSPTPTYPSGQQMLNNLIDGNWATECCFLDDTPTGDNPKTLPPRGRAPVTAKFVLDLGKHQTVGGIRFVAHKSWTNCMAENISVFACDDREGRQNVRYLKEKEYLPPINTFNAAFVVWAPVATRYLGVQIHDSYNRPLSASEGWKNLPQTPPQQVCNANLHLRVGFGWWWGGWLHTIRDLPQIGGPLYDVAGVGDRFTVEIAEVSCFLGQPADMPTASPPNVAYPENRIERDWMYQDCGVENVSMVANSTDSSKPDPIGSDISRCFSSHKDSLFEQAMVGRVLAEMKRDGVDVARSEQRRNELSAVPGCDARWKELYLDACRQRRQERLKTVRQWASQFVYVRHCALGCWTGLADGNDVTDAQYREGPNPDFHEGSQLCLATIHEDGTIINEILVDKPRGLIRNPNLSFDAKTLIFSMRDNYRTDDYHLYKMDLADRRIQQITFSPVINGKVLPCSDVEPCFAPDGDIVFQSTRIGQLDACWPTSCSNLYKCDLNGRYIRRLAIDQVATLDPQVLDDGRIIYTRWEYNDRTQVYPQPLFVMNPDGTAQTAFYGGNSDYPTALLHCRGIPGTNKVISIVSGHHTVRKGKLAIIDRTKGSEGNSGIEYVAGASPDGKPGRQLSNIPSNFSEAFPFPCDFFGQVGPQWQYPYALDEEHYLVAFHPEGCHFPKGPFNPPFGVYYMTADGRRELLAFDWSISCGETIPVMPRKQPPVKPSLVDWKQNVGTFYVQDVHLGPGMKGVKKGAAKRLRVVALEYRAAGVGSNTNSGRGTGSPNQTPPSIGGGTWDVKHVLGEVDIEADGSAYFEVPARTGVYFQLLDEKGRCVQTMRSWTMVQPGERFACLGCHDDKLEVVPTQLKPGIAFRKPAQKLQPLAGQPPHPLLTRLEKEGMLENVSNFLGVNEPCSLDAQAPVDGFSYQQLVQPILDRHCVTCHQGGTNDSSDPKKRSTLYLTGNVIKSAVWKGTEKQDPSSTGGLRDFTQSYLALTAKGKSTSLVNWVSPQSRAPMLPPYACGSTQSKVMDYLEPSHYSVQMTDADKRVIACWIDLAVPFCGSYAQANTWSKEQKDRYDYFQKKRVAFAEQEIENIKGLNKDIKRLVVRGGGAVRRLPADGLPVPGASATGRHEESRGAFAACWGTVGTSAGYRPAPRSGILDPAVEPGANRRGVGNQSRTPSPPQRATYEFRGFDGGSVNVNTVWNRISGDETLVFDRLNEISSPVRGALIRSGRPDLLSLRR